jgi:hypothetical protein
MTIQTTERLSEQVDQFTAGVRRALDALLAENLSDQEKVRRASDILMGLTLPNPPRSERILDLPDDDDELLCAGPDGMPTGEPYRADPEERDLTADEVAAMLPRWKAAGE